MYILLDEFFSRISCFHLNSLILNEQTDTGTARTYYFIFHEGHIMYRHRHFFYPVSIDHIELMNKIKLTWSLGTSVQNFGLRIQFPVNFLSRNTLIVRYDYTDLYAKFILIKLLSRFAFDNS